MMKTVNGKLFGLENSLTRKTINYSQGKYISGKVFGGNGGNENSEVRTL